MLWWGWKFKFMKLVIELQWRGSSYMPINENWLVIFLSDIGELTYFHCVFFEARWNWRQIFSNQTELFDQVSSNSAYKTPHGEENKPADNMYPNPFIWNFIVLHMRFFRVLFLWCVLELQMQTIWENSKHWKHFEGSGWNRQKKIIELLMNSLGKFTLLYTYLKLWRIPVTSSLEAPL